MSTTNTIDHPVHSGPRGTAWYVLGHLTIVFTDVLTIAMLAVVMLSSGNLTRVALGAFGVLLVVALIRPRIFRAAWSDVPGAFGYRSISRGDTFERRRLAVADYAWKALHAVVMIAGGVFLAHLDQVSPDIRAFVIGWFGGLGVGMFTALAIGGLLVDDGEPWVNRLRVAPWMTFAAWLVIALTQVDSPWASEAARFGVVMGLVLTPVVAMFKAMIRDARGQETRWVPFVRQVMDRTADRLGARFPGRDITVTEPAAAPVGWWAQWLHYLPLTATLTVGMAAATLLIGSGSWVGAGVTVVAGLVTSLLLVPMAVRFAKGPDRD